MTCGERIPEPGALPRCPSGHEVPEGARFCPACGAAVGEQPYEPKDESQLTQAERDDREQQHRKAVEFGRMQPPLRYAPPPQPGEELIHVHVLVDGFSAFGEVWMRGQEIKIGRSSPRWAEAQCLRASTAEQYRLYRREMFRPGPWPGSPSYLAGLGQYQELRTLGGEYGKAGPVAQPTEEELRRGDEAERRRNGAVPVPLA